MLNCSLRNLFQDFRIVPVPFFISPFDSANLSWVNNQGVNLNIIRKSKLEEKSLKVNPLNAANTSALFLSPGLKTNKPLQVLDQNNMLQPSSWRSEN